MGGNLEASPQLWSFLVGLLLTLILWVECQVLSCPPISNPHPGHVESTPPTPQPPPPPPSSTPLSSLSSLRIKGWWVSHHYVSTFLSGVMLTW